MKHLNVLLIIYLIICGCSGNETKKNGTAIADVENLDSLPANTNSLQVDSAEFVEAEFKDYKVYQLTESIQADFNGDSVVDTARFIINNNKAGIQISHGNIGSSTLIGGGTDFKPMGDDFSWIDYWGIVRDNETYNIIVEGGELIGEETIELEHPSIFLRKKEVGGGIITYKNGQYQWVHQSD